MSPLGLPDVDSGHEWGGKVGLNWQPFAATPRDTSKQAVLLDPSGKPLPLLVTRATAFDVPDPRQAIGRPQVPVAFNDSGLEADTVLLLRYFEAVG